MFDICVGLYLTPNHTHIISVCVQKEKLLSKEARMLWILAVMNLSAFEQVYINTGGCLIDCSEMHDNGTVLYEILLLSGNYYI